MKNHQHSALLLGLGSQLRGDDAIGLEVVESLRNFLSPYVDVFATEEMGLRLLDFIVGYQRLYVVDSLWDPKSQPGVIEEIPLNQFGVLQHCHCHGLGLPEILALGQKLGLAVPGQVTLLAIHITDAWEIREGLSETLQNNFFQIQSQIAWHILKKEHLLQLFALPYVKHSGKQTHFS